MLMKNGCRSLLLLLRCFHLVIVAVFNRVCSSIHFIELGMLCLKKQVFRRGYPEFNPLAVVLHGTHPHEPA